MRFSHQQQKNKTRLSAKAEGDKANPEKDREKDKKPAIETLHGIGSVKLAPSASTNPPAFIQPKLYVNAPGDAYEREADEMAERVVEMSDQPETNPVKQPKVLPVRMLQREAESQDKEDEEEENTDEAEGLLMRKSEYGGGFVATPSLTSQLESSKGGGEPIAPDTKHFMERAFGADFSQVRIHKDARAATMNKGIGARAFTHGQDIYFNSGAYAPEDKEGKRLLAHELAHTRQQGGADIRRKDAPNIPALTKQAEGDSATQSSKSVEPPSEIKDIKPETNKLTREGTKASPPKEKPAKAENSKEKSQNDKEKKEKSKQDKAKEQPKQEGGGAIAKEKPEKPSLDSTDTKSLRDSLAATAPSAFIQGVKESGSLVTKAQENEKSALAKEMPEIDQPTGLPTKEERSKEKEKVDLPKASAPQLKSKTKTAVKKAETKHKQTTKPATIANVPTPKPQGDVADSSFIEKIKKSIGKLPTSDEEVNTSAGERPALDMTGDADRSQNDENQRLSDEKIVEEQATADAEIGKDFGENDVYPVIEREKMKPAGELSAVPSPPDLSSIKELPETTTQVYASFDENTKAQMDEQVQAEIAKDEVERAKLETDSQKAREDGQTKIDEETEKAKQDQTSTQGKAQKEVEEQRKDWKKENDQAKKDYSDKASEEKTKTDGDIDTKVADTNKGVDDKLKEAEDQADAEKKKAETEAENKKKEAENQKPSFWDRVASAISDFFEGLKKALNSLFDALRKFVKEVIEAAKKSVNTLIDLARDAIVGLIKAFGEVLKGLVNIALAAFPDIAKKINSYIDKAVDVAVKAVNTIAEGLKKIAAAILDTIGAVLDAALALYQAAFNLLLDALEFITVGLLRIIEGMANLVLGAEDSPNHFWSQVSVEVVGQDITSALPNEVGYIEENDEAKTVGNGFETLKFAKDLVGIQEADAPPLEPEGPTEEELTSEDFENPEVDHNFKLGPDLNAQLASMPEEGEHEFGHSDEAASAAPEDTPAPQSSETPDLSSAESPQPTSESELAAQASPEPTTDTTNAPETTASTGPQVGPFKNAWERGQHVLGQIKDGISKWWEENKVAVIAGLVIGLAAGIILEIVTGGAITAAIPIILEIVAVLFAAQDIVDATIFLSQYLTKSWVGEIAAGAMSLARAFVKIILILLDLVGVGEIVKSVKGGLKAAQKGGMKAVTMAAKKAVKKGVAKQVKNFKKLGGVAKSGAKATVKNGKMVLKGMKSGLKSGANSMSDIAKNLAKKFRFKKFKFVRKKWRFFLYGELNPWVSIAEGEIKVSGKRKKGHFLISDDKLQRLKKAQNKSEGKIKEFDVAPYKETTASSGGRGMKGDKLTGDHIPSSAALKKHNLEKLLAAAKKSNGGKKLTKAQEKKILKQAEQMNSIIHNEGVTVVLKDYKHENLSRTFGGKNSAEQIAQDAVDLGGAFSADADAILGGLLKQKKLTPEIIGAYLEAYRKNVKKGVFDYAPNVDKMFNEYITKIKKIK